MPQLDCSMSGSDDQLIPESFPSGGPDSFPSVESVEFDQDQDPKNKMDDYGLSLYKTEYCRSYSDTGYCRYGNKCRFAHGLTDLRPVQRPKKYKTEQCKNYAQSGSCPYGPRCRFIHNLSTHDADELPGLGPVSSLSPFLTGQSFGTSPSARSKDSESVTSEFCREDQTHLLRDTSPANSSTSISPQPNSSCERLRSGTEMPLLRLDAPKPTLLSSSLGPTPALNVNAQPFTPSHYLLKEDAYDRNKRSVPGLHSRSSESEFNSPHSSARQLIHNFQEHSSALSFGAPIEDVDVSYSPNAAHRPSNAMYPSSRSLFSSNEVRRNDLEPSIRPLTVGASPIVRPVHWPSHASSSSFPSVRSHSSTSSSPTSPFISSSPFTPTTLLPFSLPGPFQLSASISSGYDGIIVESNENSSNVDLEEEEDEDNDDDNNNNDDNNDDDDDKDILLATASLSIVDDEQDEFAPKVGQSLFSAQRLDDYRTSRSLSFGDRNSLIASADDYLTDTKQSPDDLTSRSSILSNKRTSTLLASINTSKPPFPPRSSPSPSMAVGSNGRQQSTMLSTTSPSASVSPLALFSSPPLLSGGLSSSLSNPMFSSSLSSSPTTIGSPYLLNVSNSPSRHSDTIAASPIFGSSSPLNIIDDNVPSSAVPQSFPHHFLKSCSNV